MKKITGFIIFVLLICLCITSVRLFKDKITLRENIIRLHVVANSDSREDQTVKLMVKDEIVSYLQDHMEEIQTIDEAREYIQNNLSQLSLVANGVLREQNTAHIAKVSFCEESFGKRDYDTFSLPSGIYESLRVKIGHAEGKNWWCVVFPTLCIPATTDGFQETAVSSGFDRNLTDTLSGNGYEIRFYLLDWLGKVENFFFFR